MHAFSALSKRWQIDRCRRELSFNQSTIHLNKRTSVSPINRTTNESCMLISTNCRMYFERRATFDQWCQFSLLPSLLLFSSILQKIISAVKSHFKFKMKVLCKQVFVLALCQYDTALMIIALNGKIYRIWSGRKGNSRGIIKKKLYLITLVLSSSWPQDSIRNFLLVFRAFVFRYTRNNKIFIKRALIRYMGQLSWVASSS